MATENLTPAKESAATAETEEEVISVELPAPEGWKKKEARHGSYGGTMAFNFRG